MVSQKYYLAQANIVYMSAPLNDPIMASFVAQLQAINELADKSPGFIWRLQDETSGNNTDIRAYADERILLNLSVWESVKALSNYVYRSQHMVVMRNGRHWFKKLDYPTLVLWWIHEENMPTVDEAKERLEYLRQHGPTSYAFSFKKQFPYPNY
ncbi:MAG TPA: DUF3291 domain-containing protein [Leptolyngbyaceae cyanobacterium]